MYEARIEVTEEGADFRVRLLDLTDGEHELASGLTQATALSAGFPDVTFEGTQLTAGVLENKFSTGARLGNRQTFGAYLYRLLTPGNVGTEWEALVGRIKAQNDVLSTLLDLPENKWQTLPWELMYHNGLHLFHDERRAVGLRIPDGLPNSNSCTWPLRILVVVGCDPGKNPGDNPVNDQNRDIKWEQELLAIRRACCAFSLRFDLTVIQGGKTQQEVEKEIKRVSPHVFHFIGHATSNDGGALLLSLKENRTDRWKRDEIQAALTRQDPPRLAIINACDSAGADGVLGAGSTADAFARIGCPAVIAMRGEILGTAAAAFAGEFYKQLAEVGVNRLDQAFCRAVRAVAVVEDVDQRVWALPRIYFQTKVSEVFPLKGECGGFKKASKNDSELSEIKSFVDCQEQRFELYHQSDAWLNDDDPAHRLLLITGEEGVGKSWLLKALTYVASLRDFMTFYWKFVENTDIPRFLNAVRDAGAPGKGCFRRSLYTANVNPTHFENFEKLCGSDDAASRSGNEDRYSPVFRALADGLKKTAESGPVLLAFDDISKFNESLWKDYILSSLIKPVADGNFGGKLRIVIAAKEAEVESCGLKSLPAEPLRLDSLRADQFAALVLEHWLHQLDDGKVDEDRFESTRVFLPDVGKNYSDWKLNRLPEIFRSFLGGR